MSRFPHYHRAPAHHGHIPQALWKRRLVLPVIILLAVIVVGSFGYWALERSYTVLDAVYMTVITLGTVGYKEVGGDLSAGGRVWSIIVILVGMVAVAIAIGGIVAVVVEGQIRSVFGRRQLQRKISNISGHIIVCGYGRVGSMVAARLADSGKEVVVVEISPQWTSVAEQAGLLYVLGDAQEEETLQAAGIERAEALVAALPTDAENVFVTLSARQANPKLRIISRAQQASSDRKLRKAGASHVVCPQIIGATRMAEVVLRPAVVEFVEMAQTGEGLAVEQVRISEDSPVVGKAIRELDLPGKIGAYVVAVQRVDGSKVFRPTADTRFAPGDVVILVGQLGAAKVLAALGGDQGAQEGSS